MRQISTVGGLGDLVRPGLGLLPGDQVTRYGADVSVFALSLYGDQSKTVLGVADRLSGMGYFASITKIDPGHVYTNFHVTVGKANNAPFSVNDAKAAITAAVGLQSMSLSSIVDTLSDVVTFAAEAIPTATSDKGRSQTNDFFKNPPGFFGYQIPSWVYWTAGGLIGLYVLGEVTTLARVIKGK